MQYLEVKRKNYGMKLFSQCNCFYLDPWPSIANFNGRTLPQANLGVPKFPTFFWQVQGGLIKKPLTFVLSKDLN